MKACWKIFVVDSGGGKAELIHPPLRNYIRELISGAFMCLAVKREKQKTWFCFVYFECDAKSSAVVSLSSLALAQCGARNYLHKTATRKKKLYKHPTLD